MAAGKRHRTYRQAACGVRAFLWKNKSNPITKNISTNVSPANHVGKREILARRASVDD